jgi:methylglutaconyl-CoA hydratase
MKKFKFVTVSTASASFKNLLVVELTRAESKNAFNIEMIREMTNLFNDLKETHSGWVILKGAGDIFCAGADIDWMKSQIGQRPEQIRAESQDLYNLFEAFFNLPSPVLTLVQGGAFGGGLGLVGLSDYVIAEVNSKFSFSEVKLGIAPAVISSFLFQKFSVATLAPLMLTGRIFDAAEGLRMGLIHELREKIDFESALQFLRLSAPKATMSTKALLRKYSKTDPANKEYVIDLICKLRTDPEGQEGLKAFLEKRKAQWPT